VLTDKRNLDSGNRGSTALAAFLRVNSTLTHLCLVCVRECVYVWVGELVCEWVGGLGGVYKCVCVKDRDIGLVGGGWVVRCVGGVSVCMCMYVCACMCVRGCMHIVCIAP